MKSVLYFLTIAIAILNVESYNISVKADEDEGELILVHVIFRHGARTTYSFYPNDPYKDEKFYPYGLGQLTNEGKMGEYTLGKYLKKHYGEFLGDVWYEDLLEVRSTVSTRTKMSAMCVLAALFEPTEVQTWNKDLLWQPIPVNYEKSENEDLFHRSSNCPYKSKTMDNLLKSDLVQQVYVKPFQHIYEEIHEYSGKTIKHPGDLIDLYFNLQCEYEMNYTLPNWTEKYFPDTIVSVSSLVYGLHNLDEGVRQINSGFMLKKILDHSEAKINGNLSPNDRKMYLYSGHESTVGYMLVNLGIAEMSHIPPYGSAISIEIRKKDDEYFVKIRYRNDSQAMEPVDIKIPSCGILCPIEQFKENYAYLLPKGSIEDACKKEPSVH